MVATKVLADGSLSVPVFDAPYEDGKGRFLSEPFTLKHSILGLLFPPEDLKSLIVVKIDDSEPNSEFLRNRTFEDGQKRYFAFSSGQNYYFAGKELKAQIRDLFQTEPDTACRYGSLLTSDCFKGTQTFENLRVKIVDYQDPQYAEYKTGDCHGKISPNLAKALGAKTNTPFQFRLAWKSDWAVDEKPNLPSFLAKGTLLPDRNLTEGEGYDLIVDRSSIKGIKKSELKKLIPCGEYEFPQAVMGNRSNAKVTEYNNSWQFTIWFSEDAIRQDFGPVTHEKAQQLASLQRDPLALAKHIVAEHDKKQGLQLESSGGRRLYNTPTNHKDSTTRHEASALPLDTTSGRAQQNRSHSEELNLQIEDSDLDEDVSAKEQEVRMISLLRADKYGQLLDAPKVADYLRDYVAKKWRDLAVKTGFTHSSGMAMPAPELEQGTICAPHLPEGDIIVTRYPIVSRDNIRLYKNVHEPELMKTKNVVWINPLDAEKYHQADFDGDQLIVKPAFQMPNIAKEVRRAGEPAEFMEVKQRPKLSYTEVLDEEGNRKYRSLAEVAVASSQNKVGQVALAIGRVQSSQPNEHENPGLFERKKRKLLNRLFAGLQIEVDYQKSAERIEDVKEIEGISGFNGHKLLENAKKWADAHPCHFFKFHKDDRSYRTFTIPAEEEASVNVIPREVVNPSWSATQIRNRSREEFRYLFPNPITEGADEDEIDYWKENYLNWAEELKIRFEDSRNEIKERVGENSEAFSKELGRLYDSYRAEIEELFVEPEERMQAASALWYNQHSRPERRGAEETCLKIAKKLKTTFGLEVDYELPNEALPRDAYVLSVPFGDEALKWKNSLDERGIEFAAIINSNLPMVDFVFKDLSPKVLEKLEAKYGDNFNDRAKLDLPDKLWIIAPQNHNWAMSRTQPGVGALVYNLFSDEICQQLESTQIDKIQVLGIKYNEFAAENFNSRKWKNQPIDFEVDTLKLEIDNPNYYRYNGTPAIAIDGKILGTFSPETPKLPVASTFSGTIQPEGSKVTLHVDPESVRLPVTSVTFEKDSKQADSSFPFPDRPSYGDDNKPSKRLHERQLRGQLILGKVEQPFNSTDPLCIDRPSFEGCPTLPRFIPGQLRPQKKESTATASESTTKQSTAMDKLIAGVSAAYAHKCVTQGIDPDHNKPVRVAVGSWDAYVEASGDTRIRGGLEGETKRTIAQFNLHTAEVTQPLSLEYSKAFEQMLDEHQQLDKQQSSQPSQSSRIFKASSQSGKFLKKRQSELD